MKDRLFLQHWVGALPCVGLLVGYSVLKHVGAMSGAMLGLSMCGVYIVYGLEKVKELYEASASATEQKEPKLEEER